MRLTTDNLINIFGLSVVSSVTTDNLMNIFGFIRNKQLMM